MTVIDGSEASLILLRPASLIVLIASSQINLLEALNSSVNHRLILLHPILSYFVPSNHILSCIIPSSTSLFFYFILSNPIPSNPTQYNILLLLPLLPILSYSIMSSSIISCSILFYSILFYSILFYSILLYPIVPNLISTLFLLILFFLFHSTLSYLIISYLMTANIGMT